MDAEGLQDLFRPLGPVQTRRMFSGFGIYRDGLIIAVMMRGELYLKGDETTAAAYEAAGASHWVYEHRKTKKPVAMPYWKLPESAYDDEDEFLRLARLAVGAARRVGVKAVKPKAAKVKAAKAK